MAALNVHVVYVGFLAVNKDTGVIVNKNDPTTTINDTLNTEHRHVVIPDAAIPNSAGYPTVKRYIELEAGAGYFVQHMTQTMIITYEKIPAA